MKTYFVVYGDTDTSSDFLCADADSLDEIERRFADPLRGYSIFQDDLNDENLLLRVPGARYRVVKKAKTLRTG